jgi:hypothetical protein
VRVPVERRAHSPNDVANLTIVKGMVVLAHILVMGILAAEYNALKVSESLVILTSSIVSGLIGYMARDVKPAHGAGPISNVEHMQVDAPQPPPETDGAAVLEARD